MSTSRLTISVFLLAIFSVGLKTASARPDLLVGSYYWRSIPVEAGKGGPPTARLLTLFSSASGTGALDNRDIPLVSVLRDTLGDDDPSNDKLTAVWLLGYSHPTVSQKAVAALPFFYWRLGGGSSQVSKNDTAPLLDLSSPDQPSASNVGRQLLQWTALDTIDMPLRATSREYRTNEMDHERTHLEEAVTYLLRAPTTGADALTEEERDSVVARLELRKSLLGGFVTSNRVSLFGKEAIFQREETRSRNWELLRQCAEKTGLFFEPLSLGQSDGGRSKDQYAMLWFPKGAANEPGGSDLSPVWKLLNLGDPYRDDRLAEWSGFSERRVLNQEGSLLAKGKTGESEVTLIPLGIYSLNHPRVPLLMIDFRNNRKLRRHELLQQTINEVTAGVIGLSHFANWYYFVGADIYNFYQGRHGEATKRAERIDSYSQFRVALFSDTELDADLRAEMRSRVDSLSINPLAASEDREMKAALNRYSRLQVQASGDDNRLAKRLENQRREELAAFGETPRRQLMDDTIHTLTFGRYNHGVKSDEASLALLDTYRRVENQLEVLDRMVKAGTAPEITYQEANIRQSVSSLTGLMPVVRADKIRKHVQNTLDRLGNLSNDHLLRAECARALAAVRQSDGASGTTVPGIVASPAVLEDLK